MPSGPITGDSARSSDGAISQRLVPSGAQADQQILADRTRSPSGDSAGGGSRSGDARCCSASGPYPSGASAVMLLAADVERSVKAGRHAFDIVRGLRDRHRARLQVQGIRSSARCLSATVSAYSLVIIGAGDGAVRRNERRGKHHVVGSVLPAQQSVGRQSVDAVVV